MNKPALALLAALLAGATAALAATPQFTIKAVKKTADTRRSYERIGTVRARQDISKNIFYNVTLTAVPGPSFPTNIVVSWAVLVEGLKGRITVGALGGTATNIGRGRSVEIETDDVKIEEHEVRRKGGNFEAGDEIYAYGIRVSDLQGNLLAEKYEPSKAQTELAEAFDGKHGRNSDEREREKRIK